MKLPLSYEDALAKHPDEVAEVIAQMRKSRSKFRNSDPSAWKWSYDWGERIEGGAMSAADLFKPQKPKPVLSLEERVEDCLRRCEVNLCGNGGYAPVSSDVIREVTTKRYQDEIAEEHRVAGLSQEERDEETREALAFLRGPRNKGFMSFDVVVPSTFRSAEVQDTMVEEYLKKK